MRHIAYPALCVLFLASPGSQAGPPTGETAVTIKIATIAPEGSTWMDIAHEYETFVRDHTGGKVRFIWYTGGVMGDDPEVVRKIKLGQLQAGGFTGFGLGKIVPDVRVLEAPFLFENYDEVDGVLKKLDGTFRKLFEDRGVILLGWVEQGFIYVFTKKPVRTLNDVSGLKVWVWAGDNFVQTIFESYGYLTPVPAAIPDVLTSLQTGMINAFYNTPLGAVALQWYPSVKYMNNIPFGYGTGAVVISKKTFMGYPRDVQRALLDGGRTILPKLLASARRDNAEFIAHFPKKGIEIVNPDRLLEEDLRKKAEAAQTMLSKDFYPEWLLTGVKSTLYEFRQKKRK